MHIVQTVDMISVDNMKNDKYIMFRNFLFNELDITRDDIKEWVKEAVYEVAENYLENQFATYPLNLRIKEIINASDFNNYENSVKAQVARELAKQLEIKIKYETPVIKISGISDSSICNHEHVENIESDIIKCSTCGAVVWQKINT